jgi:septation ring formation regulator EzrA
MIKDKPFMFEKDYFDFKKLRLTVDRIEDKINKIEQMIDTITETVKGSIDYNDRRYETPTISDEEIDELYSRIVEKKNQ